MTNLKTNLKIVIGELNNEGTLAKPIYWCDFSISLNDKEVNTTLQYDYASAWIFYEDSTESILEHLNVKDGEDYEEAERQIKKALEASEPYADEKEILEELFESTFKTKENGVLSGYHNDTSIHVYELSDLSIKVAVSSYLDDTALFISFPNYYSYLKLLHSDKIWGDALDPAQFSITDRLNNYIEDNQ